MNMSYLPNSELIPLTSIYYPPKIYKSIYFHTVIIIAYLREKKMDVMSKGNRHI